MNASLPVVAKSRPVLIWVNRDLIGTGGFQGACMRSSLASRSSAGVVPQVLLRWVRSSSVVMFPNPVMGLRRD